jgi:hypothetical protein
VFIVGLPRALRVSRPDLAAILQRAGRHAELGAGRLRHGPSANIPWGVVGMDPGAFLQANVSTVLPGYFETMRTPVLEGRSYTPADQASGANVVIVDDMLAARAYPGESAIGRPFVAATRRQRADAVRTRRRRGAQAQTRFALWLIGLFAVIAATLAVVGLYGVLAALVRQRTRAASPRSVPPGSIR